MNHRWLRTTVTAAGLRMSAILKGAFFEWNEDKVPRMAAAIAFYAVFSLTPIVVIAFKLAEAGFGTDVLRSAKSSRRPLFSSGEMGPMELNC